MATMHELKAPTRAIVTGAFLFGARGGRQSSSVRHNFLDRIERQFLAV
jgi:hypothetical protein